MKPALFLPALAVLGLSGCVTGYGYSDDGYYYARPSVGASTSYGGIGYGSGSWRYGYGIGYGHPGGFGYGYPGYHGYYDPYYGYYPWPPVVIIRPPPDPGDDDDDDDGQVSTGKHPPPWRDPSYPGRRPLIPAQAPKSSDGLPPRTWQPPVRNDPPRQPERVRMPTPTPPMPRMDDDMPTHKGDRRR